MSGLLYCNQIIHMNNYRLIIAMVAIILMFATVVPAVWAAGQVQLELVGDARGAAMSFQDWIQALGNAGIKNVRLRSAADVGKPGIDVQGTADRPIYIVTGQVISRDELLLPGARFKRSEVKSLAAWLDDLAQNGPPDKRPKIVAFGMTATQFDQVMKDLVVPVGFNTQGLARRDAVAKIVGKLRSPVRFEGDSAKALSDDKVEEELTAISSGSAMACLLRPIGCCLVPQLSGGEIKYSVVRAQSTIKDVWPIGRTPLKPLPGIVPGLFEFLNVNVQNVSAATAIEAVGKRLKTPVLYDHIALAKYKIDPGKAMVSFARARSNYSMALEKMLFPAGLQFEVREDEAGTVFLWVTTVKPM
jgi:hypothetical protein